MRPFTHSAALPHAPTPWRKPRCSIPRSASNSASTYLAASRRSSSSPRSTTAPSRPSCRTARRDRRAVRHWSRSRRDGDRPRGLPRSPSTAPAPTSRSASPASRWATSSPRWCWRCCRSAATRQGVERRAHRADPGLDGELPLRDLLLAVLPELPRRRAGAEPDGVLNPNITHVAIDGALFQDEVEERQVMAVPTVFLNGELVRPGPHELEQIVAKLDTGAADARRGRRRRQGAVRRARRRRRPRRRGRRRSTPRARASAPASSPSASAARCSTPWASRTSSRCPTPKARSWPRRSRSTSRSYDVDVMNLQRATRLVPADEVGGLITVELESGATLSSPHGRPRHRRALAPHERARRGRVPQQGRGLLPALRRPAVQGQARRGDRRRQLRRRGGDRPRRHRRARDADRVRRRSSGPTRCCSASSAACPTST